LDTFRNIFDAVLKRLPSPTASLPAGSFELAAAEGHCKWVKAHLRRNVSGIAFAPCCTKEERREVERLLVQAIETKVESANRYVPLAHSQSQPNLSAAAVEDQERLVLLRKLFKAPRTVAELDSGVGRDWPDARGAFLVGNSSSSDHDETIFWINQANHFRVRCGMAGGDLSAVLKQAQGLADTVEKALQEATQGTVGFARHPELGFATVDAMHLGSGITFTACLSLPKLSCVGQFGQLCAALGVSEKWRDGLCELSSFPSPGLSAEELLAWSAKSFGALVELEQSLEQGSNIDAQVKALLIGSE